jgi:hypothetical protein
MKWEDLRDPLRVIAALVALAIVVGAVALGFWLIVDPEEFADVDLTAVNVVLGTALVCSGVALAALGFIFGVLFPPKQPATPLTAAQAIDLSKAIEALTKLLQQTGGLGIALLLFGVILLTGTALGSDDTDADDATPSASPTSTPTSR